MMPSKCHLLSINIVLFSSFSNLFLKEMIEVFKISFTFHQYIHAFIFKSLQKKKKKFGAFPPQKMTDVFKISSTFHQYSPAFIFKSFPKKKKKKIMFLKFHLLSINIVLLSPFSNLFSQKMIDIFKVSSTSHHYSPAFFIFKIPFAFHQYSPVFFIIKYFPQKKKKKKKKSCFQNFIYFPSI